MKLTIRRNQADVKGFFGGHKGVSFSLYGHCAITDGERELIAKYGAGNYALASYQYENTKGEVFSFNITVNDLVAGKSIETGDINTLLQLEGSMKQGCAKLKNLLEVMASFGGEQVYEI